MAKKRVVLWVPIEASEAEMLSAMAKDLAEATSKRSGLKVRVSRSAMARKILQNALREESLSKAARGLVKP